MSNIQPMIGKHKNWRFLLRELRESFPPFKPVTDSHLKMMLTTPATIAYWLSTYHQELLKKDTLNILIVGAGTIDAGDKGSWYSAIPLLLGNNAKINVDLVGPHLWHDPNKSDPHPINTQYSHLFSPCATGYKMHFADYFKEKNSQIDFDICAIFHPGFTTHTQDWFESGDIDKIRGLNIPTLLTFYDQSEAINDRICLKAYGYDDLKDPVKNPFCMDDIDSFAGYPHYYFSELPLKKGENDLECLNLYRICEALVAHEHDCTGKITGLYGIGEHFKFKFSKDNFVKLGLGFFISLSSGYLHFFNGEDLSEENDNFAEQLIHLDTLESPYDKFIWALDVLEHIDIDNYYEEEDGGDEVDEPSEFQHIFDHFKIPEDIAVPKKNKAIINAMKNNDNDLIMDLLKKDPSLCDAENEAHESLLYYAAISNDVELTKYLLDLGADPNHIDNEGWPIISEIVRARAYDTLEIFIELDDLDIHRRSKFGWTAILLAKSNDDDRAIQLLLEGGADIDDVSWGEQALESFVK